MKEGGYEHRVASFGDRPFGKNITGSLYYADSDLCDPSSVPLTGGYPERPIGSNGIMEPIPSPFILMVDGGRCSFASKVR